MRKKLLPLALALILCLSLAAPAFAADSGFVIENGVLTEYNGPGGDVVIPDGVTSIGDEAFLCCQSLTSVTIPDSVTSIGDDAFYYCYNLTSVSIPNGVTSIGGFAFVFCTGLKSVTIPDSVTSIGNGAFASCDNLTAIQVDANNQRYCSVDGVVFSKDMKTLAAYPAGRQGAYSIPDGVTSIGDGAFDGGGVTGVTIPDSITSIGDGAFKECDNLASVTIPNSVTNIGRVAFYNCESLKSVTIPDSVTSIGEGMFWCCDSLTSVAIPGSVTSIGEHAFYGCFGLKSVTIPSSVTSIGECAFDDCFNLTDVYYGGTEAQWKAVTIGEENDDGLLNATIHYNSTAPDTLSQSETAMPTNDKLTVNGVLQNPTVYKIGGSNFFKIRDLAAMLNGTEKQFDVDYDDALKSVTATTGKGYAKLPFDLVGAATGGSQPAAPSNDTIYIDGQKIDVTVYKIGGSNFFMLRDLGKALDFYVGWTREAGVFIDTGKPYSE